MSYGHNKHGQISLSSEGNSRVARPAEGYLWDRSGARGWRKLPQLRRIHQQRRTPNDPGKSRVTSLQGHFDEWLSRFRPRLPDQKRVDRFISELKTFREAEGEMPRLQIVRLPKRPHLTGVTPGKHTPVASGRRQRPRARSNSSRPSAIRDSAADRHLCRGRRRAKRARPRGRAPHRRIRHQSLSRNSAPWTRRWYSTSSMLRTMELILGLEPMSQYDAAATPNVQLVSTRNRICDPIKRCRRMRI